MRRMFRFRCRNCEEWHEGIPSVAANAPLYCYAIPEAERAGRCDLTSDTCVVDDEFFFVRGLLEIPVEGLAEMFSWGVWVSLSKAHFDEYLVHRDDQGRAMLGPYFGWLSAAVQGYPDTENLKTMVHPREPALRPLIELEPTDHPLAVEQREGISQDRLAQILENWLHPSG